MTSSTMSMMLTNMSGLMRGQTTLTNALSHSVDLLGLKSATCSGNGAGKDALGSRRRVLLAALLVHVEPDAFKLLFDLADHEAVREKDADRDGADDLGEEDEAAPSRTAPGGEEPNQTETGFDRERVKVDGVGDHAEASRVDGRREWLQADIGRLDRVRCDVVDVRVAGTVQRRSRLVQLRRVEVVGIKELRFLEVCAGGRPKEAADVSESKARM